MKNKILIKDRLKELRDKKGITRNKLYDETGISRHALIEWELGKCLPNCKFLITLSKYYGVSSDYILGLTDNPKPYPENMNCESENCVPQNMNHKNS